MLNYLFEATFADRSVIVQTQDDQSKVDPTKSAFYDILQYYSHSDLTMFSLVGPGGATVYLESGHFRVNGVTFEVGPKIDIPTNVKRRLIYFRDVCASTDVTISSKGVVTKIERLPSVVKYMIGWQATVDDENVQRIIVIE